MDEGYLRADLHNRKTADETQMFLNAVAGASKVLECGRVLVSVHSSIPMSVRETSEFLTHLNRLGASHPHKVAVLGAALGPDVMDTHGGASAPILVRGFADEAAATQWVRDRRHGHDRRNGQERRLGHDSAQGQDLRLRQAARLEQDLRLGCDRRLRQVRRQSQENRWGM
jgi:hypothetical protein